MDSYNVALVSGVALVVALGGIRAVELLSGHHPTDALTAAFTGAVAAVILLLGAARVRNGH